jgi:hypothetical protein
MIVFLIMEIRLFFFADQKSRISNPLPPSKLPKMIKLIAPALVLTLFSSFASSQTMKNLTVDSTSVNVNSNVKFTLEIDRNMQNTLLCGLVMDYGNGEVKQYIAGLNGNADEKMVITYQFNKAGTYQVSADGKLPITDAGLLAKALSVPPMCWGGKKTVTVTVIEAAQKAADVTPASETARPKPVAPIQTKPEAPKAVAPKPAIEAAPKGPATAPAPAPVPKAKAESIL